MAKISSQTIELTLSKMVRDSESVAPILNDEGLAQLEAILSELIEDSDRVLIEIEQNFVE